MYGGIPLKTEIIQYLRRFVYEREIMELQCSLCLDRYKISRLETDYKIHSLPKISRGA